MWLICFFSFLPEYLPEHPVGKRRGGEHIPEKCHREVFEESSDPDSRELCDGISRQDHVKQDGIHKAHGRAHDGDGSGLPQKLAYVRIIFFRIAVSGREGCADAVSPAFLYFQRYFCTKNRITEKNYQHICK